MMNEEKHMDDILKKQERPEIPEKYFESFHDQLMQKISSESKVIPLYKRPAVWISSIAATILVIIGFSLFNPSDNKPLIAMEDLSNEEVYRYIDENIDAFDSELIQEVLYAERFTEEPGDSLKKKSNAATSPDKKAVSFEELSREDILKYLQQEELTIEEIEEEIEN